MYVDHLLNDDSLGLRLLWAEEPQLRREISGVTATDLEDPARFVRPGEVVLSGLVWWNQEDGADRAERFVSALRGAGAAVLLAGEETHGVVPEDLVEACRRYGLPVAAVPAHIMFRAITDTVYLQQWGELSRLHALPETVRGRLHRLLTREAGPDDLVEAAFAHLDRPLAYVFTATGRTVAATEAATAVPVPPREAVALMAGGAGVTLPIESETVSPYGRWLLHLPRTDDTPPRLLQEIAAVLARCQESRARRRAGEQQAADELGALLVRPGAEASAVRGALRACGLDGAGAFRVIVADAYGGGGAGTHADAVGAGLAEGALAEAVAHVRPEGVAVGRLPDGAAFAVVTEEEDGSAAPAPGAGTALADVWPLLTGCEPAVRLHGGIGAAGVGPEGLNGALEQARYALASARTTGPDASVLTDAASLTGLDTLLTGIPAEVRAAFSRTVLGGLLDPRSASATVLLETLETFLRCDGSWARTAEALHLHVNTVHYRIGRIEHFTGRDLSRLHDRLDLRAALLCRERPGR